jgi:hypothetical protein
MAAEGSATGLPGGVRRSSFEARPGSSGRVSVEDEPKTVTHEDLTEFILKHGRPAL